MRAEWERGSACKQESRSEKLSIKFPVRLCPLPRDPGFQASRPRDGLNQGSLPRWLSPNGLQQDQYGTHPSKVFVAIRNRKKSGARSREIRIHGHSCGIDFANRHYVSVRKPCCTVAGQVM